MKCIGVGYNHFALYLNGRKQAGHRIGVPFAPEPKQTKLNKAYARIAIVTCASAQQ